MPRNSSGTYSLYTPGNPVVTGTTISSTWANNTLSDLATAVTDSLSRSGDGAMLAPLELDSGAVGAPGLSWGAEGTSGLYRAGAGDFRYSISGVDKLTLTSTLTTFATAVATTNATLPTMRLSCSGAAADRKNTLMRTGSTGEFALSLSNDAAPDTPVSNFMTMTRTGTTVDTVNFPSGTLTYGGVEVGYRGMPQRTFSASDTTATTDPGRCLEYTGAGGHTITLDGDPATESIITIINNGSGNLTVATTGTISWFNGSGTISSGSRTLAVGGVLTSWRIGANFRVWGTGLS